MLVSVYHGANTKRQGNLQRIARAALRNQAFIRLLPEDRCALREQESGPE